MRETGRQIHHHRHPGYAYPVRLRQRLYGLVAVPLVAVIIAFIVVHPQSQGSSGVSVFELVGAITVSMLRLLIAYVLACIVALPLALLISRGGLVERVLLPTYDVLQSIPVFAFFPVIIVFFLNYHFLQGAAVLMIFATMLWNLVFSLVGGIRAIPRDIVAMAQVYKIARWTYLRQVVMPAVIPYVITGSLLSWAAGWNILIVVEVLHTYIPGGTPELDIFGIGSVLVHASKAGHADLFTGAILMMVTVIALMNLFMWQRLLRYAERYHFE